MRLPSVHRVCDPQGRAMTGELRHAPYCLLHSLTTSAPWTPDFAAQWLARWFPLSTLRATPHDATRMTRGLIDSPFLISIKLSLTISCQLDWRSKHPVKASFQLRQNKPS